MAWQPIETAPRDGTAILGYAAGKRDRFGCGRTVFCPCRNKWVFCEPDGRVDAECPAYWEPTHWMPLPEPPR